MPQVSVYLLEYDKAGEFPMFTDEPCALTIITNLDLPKCIRRYLKNKGDRWVPAEELVYPDRWLVGELPDDGYWQVEPFELAGKPYLESKPVYVRGAVRLFDY